jgi:hypothetical protein
MKLQIGTRVKFLNDTGGGIIRGFRDDKIVLVETDDGFEMPILATELIIEQESSYSAPGEHGGSGMVDPGEGVKVESKPEISFEEKKFKDFSGEVLLALVPENEKLIHVSNFSLYLVNDSNYYFHFVLTSKDKGVSTLVRVGSVEPDTKLEIEKYNQTSITKIKEFHIQGFFYKYGLMQTGDPIDMKCNIENVSFYKAASFKENDYFHQHAIIFKREAAEDMNVILEQLKESDLSHIASIKESKVRTEKSKSPKNTVIEEVDLHIEEIIDNHNEMSNGEIINLQLARFETALETGIRGKTKKIVFIHGVGNGKLKHELRKKLDKKYPDIRYQDASFKEYGYGATMVFLR